MEIWLYKWYNVIKKGSVFSMNDKVILQYKLNGFSGLKLENISDYKISNKYIDAICLTEDVSSLTVILNEGISYADNKENIEIYLDHICFNLIIKTEADIFIPFRQLTSIKDGNNISINEHLSMSESVSIIRRHPAENIYSNIVNSPTNFKEKQVIYDRIFKTLQNPNFVVQFMSLYQLLMELLSVNGEIRQRNVVDYLKNNHSKYTFVNFQPTRKTNIKTPYDEDNFTYLRNEIGHSEDTNNMELYKKLGSQVNMHTIKKLVCIINDVIITLP